MKSPYLIQRAEIKRPIAVTSKRLSQAVSFDYMGAAEFEYGALPQSFRRIEQVADNWVCRLVPEITEGETPLRVWSAFSDEEFVKYIVYLKKLRDPNGTSMYTKESVYFEENHKNSSFSKTDFWWDITNDVMFGFNKVFMKRVGEYVASSLIYMNEEKAKNAKPG